MSDFSRIDRALASGIQRFYVTGPDPMHIEDNFSRMAQAWSAIRDDTIRWDASTDSNGFRLMLRRVMSAHTKHRQAVIVDLDTVMLDGFTQHCLERSGPQVLLLMRSSRLDVDIASRFPTFHVGAPDTSTVYDYLRRIGMTDDEATSAASVASNSITRARVALESLRTRTTVLRALEAVRDDDARMLEEVLSEVTPACARSLRTLVHEAATGQYRVFRPEDGEMLKPMIDFAQATCADVTDRSPVLLFSGIFIAMLHQHAGRLG